MSLGLVAALGLAACGGGSTSAQKAAVAGILGDTSSNGARTLPNSSSSTRATSPPLGATSTTSSVASTTTTSPSAVAWTLATTETVPLSGVSCPTPSMCIAVGGSAAGGDAVTLDNGGSTWQSLVLPAGTPALRSIACASTTTCVAVGGADTLRTADGGATWASQTVAGISALNGVNCVDTTTCIAVGTGPPSGGCASSGASITTDDGAADWSTASIVPCAPLSGIDCPTAQVCFATGVGYLGPGKAGVIEGSTDFGARWNQQLILYGSHTELDDVACTNPQSCIAVGSATYRAIVDTTNAGDTWNAAGLHAIPSGSRSWFGVACWSAEGCEAVGASQPVTLNSTGSWTSQNLPGAVGTLNAITCPGPSECVAVGAGAVTGGAIALYR